MLSIRGINCHSQYGEKWSATFTIDEFFQTVDGKCNENEQSDLYCPDPTSCKTVQEISQYCL